MTDLPNITSISLNQTVDEGDLVLLNCTADGNPEPNITWTRLSDNSIVSMPLDITGKQDEGGYRCIADNRIGNAAFFDVFITIQCKSHLLSIFELRFKSNCLPSPFSLNLNFKERTAG